MSHFEPIEITFSCTVTVDVTVQLSKDDPALLTWDKKKATFAQVLENLTELVEVDIKGDRNYTDISNFEGPNDVIVDDIDIEDEWDNKVNEAFQLMLTFDTHEDRKAAKNILEAISDE